MYKVMSSNGIKYLGYNLYEAKAQAMALSRENSNGLIEVIEEHVIYTYENGKRTTITKPDIRCLTPRDEEWNDWQWFGWRK